MLYYILFLIFILFLAIITADKDIASGKKRFEIKISYFMISVLLILFVGLRKIGVSVDDYNYQYIYESANRGLVFKDIGFILLSRTFPNFQSLIFFLAVISISLKVYYFVDKLQYLGIAFLVYFSSYYFLHDFVQIRAAIASGILFWIIDSSARRKPGMYILLLLISISFHLSALIFIPIYFLGNQRSRNLFLIAFVLSLIVGLFFPLDLYSFNWLIPDIILKRLSIFLEESGGKANLLNPIAILHYGMAVLILIFWKEIFSHSKSAIYIAKLFLIGVFTLLIFHKIPGIGFRIYELLVITQIPLIDILLQTVKPRKYIMAGSILLSLLYFYYYLIKYPVIQPYSFNIF